MLERQNNERQFAVGLKDAPCKEPVACCATCLCMFPCGFPACWFRKKALDKLAKFPDDYLCCQGYFSECCGLGPGKCGDRGNTVCFLLEGCCFPVLSLSFTRIMVMDANQLAPDPMDYQIIQFSNCLQLLACICQIAALIQPDLQECANIIDCIADAVTLSVAACMGAQINHELNAIPQGTSNWAPPAPPFPSP